MVNDFIFEILTYTCHQEALTKRIEREIREAAPRRGEARIIAEQHQEELSRRMHSVRYNEIVGAIEIYPRGHQIRADYWLTSKKRIVINSKQKGTILWKGKLIEASFYPKIPSAEVFKRFRRNLERAVNERRRLKNLYVDFQALDRIGPFVDWSRILEPPVS